MNRRYPDDPLFDALAGLPVVRPDAEQVERVGNRCRAAFRKPARRMPVAFEPITVGAVCALYAWQVARIAMRIPLP